MKLSGKLLAVVKTVMKLKGFKYWGFLGYLKNYRIKFSRVLPIVVSSCFSWFISDTHKTW